MRFGPILEVPTRGAHSPAWSAHVQRLAVLVRRNTARCYGTSPPLAQGSNGNTRTTTLEEGLAPESPGTAEF